MIRFTTCDCDAPLRLLPRHGWKRLFASRQRYRCSACKAEFFLRKDPKPSLRQRLVVSAALLLALLIAYWGSGYIEEARDAAWRRDVTAE